ncbi:AAA family ATPase, partial [Candidatus Woesearchaeota archaeon]|nr:AAA family ATPase [Candidatus Woesearchaeota archaeon]
KYQLLEKGGNAYASPLLFATLTSLLNHGTMLITGAYGIGKTTGAEFAGHFFTGTSLEEIMAATIQGHPQQKEEKMVGRYHVGKLIKGDELTKWRKFITCPVHIVDEISRMDPDKLSIILRALDTGLAQHGDDITKMTPGPLFATANYADSGTFELPPPALDRFDIAVTVTSPQEWDLEKIYARKDEKLNGGITELLKIPKGKNLTKQNFNMIRKEITELPEHGDLKNYLNFAIATIRYSDIASTDPSRMTKGNIWNQTDEETRAQTHPSAYTQNELSVRTVRAIPRYARALAWLNGDTKVSLEHLKAIFPYAVWHKLAPSQKATDEWKPFKIANDRIAFAKKLLEEIDREYAIVQGASQLNDYSTALEAIKTGKILEKKLNQEQILNITKNALIKIGQWDKPYAITLAKHLESEYNRKIMQND